MELLNSFVTIVSGAPRSGTSLMMQMLAAGGLPLLADAVRTPDVDNPEGYFEFEPVKRTATDSSWIAAARGKAVKAIYAILPSVPAGFEYRVIWMQRDLREVLASQRAMLARSGAKGADVEDERIAAAFATELAACRAWLGQQPHFTLLEVAHRDCIEKASAVAAEVSRFLGGGLNEDRMAAVTDTRLYRHRPPY